jgi:hypothetical protein
MMLRLFKTEPHLAIYIEAVAAHLSGRREPKMNAVAAMTDALQRILVIVRAVEIGHHRLWRDSIPANSPLGRLIEFAPENDPKDQQKKS